MITRVSLLGSELSYINFHMTLRYCKSWYFEGGVCVCVCLCLSQCVCVCVCVSVCLQCLSVYVCECVWECEELKVCAFPDVLFKFTLCCRLSILCLFNV